MASIELNIYQELSSIGKLAMMNRIDSLLPINESKANLASEEVMDAIHEGLAPYMDAQLVVYYENHVEMQPYLVQVMDAPELQRVIWQVTVSGSDDNFTFFDLIIDDETGKILRINYTHEQPLSENERKKYLDIFADIYFSSLDIPDYTSFATRDLEKLYIGENTCGVRYRFGDAVYGEIHVDLYVHAYGFYIEFPHL